MIDGIGLDINKFNYKNISVSSVRKNLNFSDSDIILLSIGELSKNKNHQVVIKAISELKNPKIKYLICGSGKLEYKLKKLIKRMNVEQQIFLMGFREDIPNICRTADIFIFPSLREGLPVALMEAMFCSLPVIASDIRGNRDLIKNKYGGFLVPSTSVLSYKKAIDYLIHNKDLQKEMGRYNFNTVKKYSLDHTLHQMKEIYFGQEQS